MKASEFRKAVLVIIDAGKQAERLRAAFERESIPTEFTDDQKLVDALVFEVAVTRVELEKMGDAIDAFNASRE